MNPHRIGIALIVSLLFATPGFGIWGTLDQVPGSTVILPFFEVGINSAQNPHDTLPTIYNSGSDLIVHWEAYDIDGIARFWGDQTIDAVATWAFSMRSLINNHASQGPTVAVPFFRSPVSSTTNTASSPGVISRSAT